MANPYEQYLEPSATPQVSDSNEKKNPYEQYLEPFSAESNDSTTRININALPDGLKPYAKAFEEAGKKYGIDPNLLAAISWHETAGGTSKAFREGNNAMGISNSYGPIYGFDSPDQSIDRQAKTLANPNGPYHGASSIPEIARVYAPIGAENDPNNQNHDWANGVSSFYNKLKGSSDQPDNQEGNQNNQPQKPSPSAPPQQTTNPTFQEQTIKPITLPAIPPPAPVANQTLPAQQQANPQTGNVSQPITPSVAPPSSPPSIPTAQQSPQPAAEDQTKRPVGFWEAAGRGLVGGLAKTNELMAQGVGIFPYLEDKTLHAFGINSDIYNRYIQAVHSTGLGQPGVDAEAIKPSEQLTTLGTIGQGVGEGVASLPPMIASGGIGAESEVSQGLFQAVKPIIPQIKQGIQAMLPMAVQSGADAVKESANQGDNQLQQVAKGIASATSTAALGAIPLAQRSKIANPILRFLEQGAYGYLAGLPIGEQQKATESWMNGKPYVPSEFKDMAIQAIPMGLMTGAFGILHKPSPEAPKLAPSPIDAVNQKEAEINSKADAQFSGADERFAPPKPESLVQSESQPPASDVGEAPVAEQTDNTQNKGGENNGNESNQTQNEQTSPQEGNGNEKGNGNPQDEKEVVSGESQEKGLPPTEEVEQEDPSSIGENLDQEEKSFVVGLASKAREDIKNFGPGAANAEEFKVARTAIGAEHLLEGKTNREEWNSAMAEDGYNEETMSKQELNQLWNDSKDFVRQFEKASNPSLESPKESILRTTEGKMARGTKDAWVQAKGTIEKIKSKINDSVSKAKAFSEYLKGMEKGAKIGANEVRRNVKVADRWLSADQEVIRKNLVDLVNSVLPKEERGKFLNRITQTLKRTDILKGDQSKMYKREAKLTGVILRHADNVYKKGIISDIKKIFNKAIAAKNIDVRYKGVIKDFFKDLEFTGISKVKFEELTKRKADLDESIKQGKGSSFSDDETKELERLGRLPLRDMPIGALEQLKEQMQRVFEEGKNALAITKEEQKDQQAQLLEEMAKAPSNSYNKHIGKFADADKVEQFKMVRGFANKITTIRNQLGTIDIAALPTDAAIEWLDGLKGNYLGFLQKHFKGGIDLGYNSYSAEGNAIRKNISDLAKKEKISLSGNVMGKISIFANLQQKGGRERMIESGSTSPESIARIEKSGLTSGEMRLYNAMRGHFEKLGPEIREIMHQLYNVQMGEIENYWPMPRDWEKFNEIRQSQLKPDSVSGNTYDERSVVDEYLLSANQANHLTTKVDQSNTINRVKNADTPIKLSAFNDFNKAIDNMLFIKHLQPVLKQLGELARKDEFNEKYGAAGQKYILDWLDTVARKGSGVNTMAWLDAFGRNISSGIIGFRPSSQLKHTAFIPYAIYHSGGAQWYIRGLFAGRTKQGKEWVKNNAAEISGRSGSDIYSAELQNGKGFLGTIQKNYSKVAFALVRSIDHENSSAVVLGRYMHELNKKGLDWSNFDKYPVNIDAQKMALIRMRRAVASPGYKDIPLMVSRGMGLGGNSSIAKTVMRFQNPQLDQWSNIRVDLLAAMLDRNAGRTLGIGAAIATSSAIEAGVHIGVGGAAAIITGGLLSMFTGKPAPVKNKDDDIPVNIAEEYAKNFLTKMPLTPQLWNMIEYHGFHASGIPAIDFATQTADEIARAFTTKSDEAKIGHAIQAVGNIITGTTGMPGSQALTSFVKNLAVDPDIVKQEAHEAAKETREAHKQDRQKTTTVHTLKPIKIKSHHHH